MSLFGLATLALALSVAGAFAGEPVTAEIKVFQFQPKVIEVHAGATVTWTNDDNIDHTVTSGTPDAPDGAFASAPFGKGKSFTATFDKPGEYVYFCSKHKSMHGTIKVLPAG
jgi:plastocyanin